MRLGFLTIQVLLVCALPILMRGLVAAQTSAFPDHGLIRHLTDLCPAGIGASPDALLRRQTSQAPMAMAGDRAGWETLACTRAWLAGHDVRSRESWLMPLGASWRDGAANIALKLLDTDPGDRFAISLLVALSEDRVLAKPDRQVAPRLAAAIGAGVAEPIVWRLCAEVYSRLDDTVWVNRCSHAALMNGADSTLHLIHLARLSAKASDTASTVRHFLAAIGVVSDSASKMAADWQVRWFLWPDEEMAWDTMATESRRPWLTRLLALRDVRDGRPPGARVMEHFKRLEYVLGAFRMEVLPINRKRVMELAATPDGPGGECDLTNWGASLGASCVLRDYRRWQAEIDDRGAVWMRFGEPGQRLFLTESGEPTLGKPTNNVKREAWKYEVDGQSMILSFESEGWDGTEEATRIIPTALRPFICGVDSWRCFLMNRDGSPTRLLSMREQDFQMLDAATQRDNNAPPVARHIRVSARYLRLWDPASELLIAIAPWSVRLEDLEVADSIARFDLVVNLWDGVRGVGFDTTVRKEYRLPRRRSGDAQVTGVLDLPASPGISGWSLFTRQEPDAGGRAFDIDVAPFAMGPLAVSDLVLGAAGQGVNWNGTREPVVLAPLGVIDRKEGTLHLYFQVRSEDAYSDAVTSIRVYRSDRRGDSPAISVSIPGRLSTGINEVRREIGLGELDAGSYRLEVEVRTGNGVTAARSAPLVLR